MKAKDLNKDTRAAIKKAGLKNYQVANALGIATTTFATWLQSELTPERKKRVKEAIRSYGGKIAPRLNEDIRTAIFAKGLASYEVAAVMGLSPSAFYHLLEKELPQEKREQIFAAIESVND